MSESSKRTYSEEARSKMRDAALARYERDAQLAHDRVRAVMKAIQLEIAGNAGIYPHNKGAVSMAEVARRAEIHPFTFHKPRYKELGAEVKTWLERLKKGSVVGRGRVRKELATRVQEWQQLYEDLLDVHRLSETDLEHARAQLKEVQDENHRLRQAIAEQAKLKVVPMRIKKTD